MISAAQARAQCLAQGSPADACDEMIRNKTLPDGTFCDGDLVLFLDAQGNKAKRCVPAATVDRKLALMQIPAQPMSITTRRVLIVLGVAGAAALVWYVTR